MFHIEWRFCEGRARMAKLTIAALLAAVAMAAASPDRAEAEEIGLVPPDSDIGFADSDGYVPLYRDCLPNDLGALYLPYTYDGVTVEGGIVVNECAIERLGVGPTDLERLIAHEGGHSRGLLHSEDPYDIMYPYLTVTGT